MILFEDDNTGNLTLSQLNGLVREVVELSMPAEYWVEAELASVRESKGHCYMELVEKDEFTNTPKAQSRACCWRNTWQRVLPAFIRETGQPLCPGMKVLLKVKASFHEAFGFSWIVTDVNAAFTMGDMARRRKEILRILKEEGVIDLNKSLRISPFAKRIAVISSATAAGYGDFCNELSDNEFGFTFSTQLFPAIMQGEQVEESVVRALDAINERLEEFDVVVIIRGGGSTSDLSGFDTLTLAENVANFPLPVITGIGHDRDQSVLDVVACVCMKTPTAVAGFLVDNLLTTSDFLDDCSARIFRIVQERMKVERLRMQRIEQTVSTGYAVRKLKEERIMAELQGRMANAVARRLMAEQVRLDRVGQRLPMVLKTMLEREKHRMQLLEQRVKAADPINVLKRGYSITLHNGLAVKDAKGLVKGDELTILVSNGVVTATVSENY